MGFKAFAQRFDEAGHSYHVIHKAVAKTALFRDDSDRERYIRQLRDAQRKVDVTMLAQGMLTFHTHGLLLSKTGSHSDFMHRWGSDYAHSFNLLYDRNGHLFGEPFWSRPILSEMQFLATLRYVLRQALEAGIVRSLEELARHPWTSLGALLGNGMSRTEQSADLVLVHFSDDRDEARRLLMKWLSYESRFDPYAADPCPSALEEFERLCSDSFRRAFDREQALYKNRDALTLDQLIRWACHAQGVVDEDFRPRSRTTPVSTARGLIAYVGIDLLGLPQSAIARRLGISQPAVSKAVGRGKSAFVERFGSAATIDAILQEANR